MTRFHLITALEFLCIAVIAAGVAFISWPIAMVIAGALVLVALQGFKSHDEESD